MTNNMRPIYKRVLLKLSGEVLQGHESFGIDPTILNRIAHEIKTLIKLGVQVSVVVGGGNLFRGEKLAKSGMNRVSGDHMGMLATVMNGLALRDSLERIHVNTNLMSAISLKGVCNDYNWSRAIGCLLKKQVVIFSSGTGNPFFTTDSAACLRGIEIEADVVLKATKVDGVYSDDPINNPNAILYKQLTYAEILHKELKIMDLTALTLARDYKLPIHVFNINKCGALFGVIMGEEEGTLIKIL
ncbi:MAG: UMP kinase [Pantoea sp. Brub]|nr:UMP kinase [Pantoea sp. Brub]